MFRDSRRLDCYLDRFLNHRLIHVVAALDAGFPVKILTCYWLETRIAIPTGNPRWDTCEQSHRAVSFAPRLRANPFRECAWCSSDARSDPASRWRAASSPCLFGPCRGERVFPSFRNRHPSRGGSNTPAIEGQLHTTGRRPARARLSCVSKPIGLPPLSAQWAGFSDASPGRKTPFSQAVSGVPADKGKPGRLALDSALMR